MIKINTECLKHKIKEQLRVKFGNQINFAKTLGCSRKTLNRYINHLEYVNLKTIIDMLNLLDISGLCDYITYF